MTLAPGVSYVDLHFLGRRRAIATAIIRSAGEVALVDPGPTTCLATLEEGLHAQGVRLSDITQLLLTHIHLDHAGASGTLVQQQPHIKVFVNEHGAPHLVYPEKLLKSAERLYGTEGMAKLWGDFLPVPPPNVVVLQGGERIAVAGRQLDVLYTPGHASHHVSYIDRDNGLAFVGDTAGICIDGGYVLPPTPPPDIDLELWSESARRIQATRPSTLFLTHFGPSSHPPETHLERLLENLRTTRDLARATLEEEGTDDERRVRFAERLQRELRRSMSEDQIASYSIAAPFESLWLGLARYLRRKTGSRG